MLCLGLAATGEIGDLLAPEARIVPGSADLTNLVFWKFGVPPLKPDGVVKVVR